jgi:hypothetical protein
MSSLSWLAPWAQRVNRVISQEASTTKQHAAAAALLFVLVSVALFPYVFGSWTLQDSAALGVLVDTPPAQNQLSRTQDPVSAAAIAEPDLALDHRIYLHEHQPPIWNPYLGFGQPLAAGMLAQPYSPLAWIAILWNTARGYDVFLVARLVAGGWLTYLFLRQFVSFLPAFAGGVTFAFSGALWSYLTIQDLTVDVMIPGLFYAAERLVRKPGPHSIGVAALIFAVTTFGGQPEPEAIAVAVMVLYWLVRLAYAARERRERLVPIVGASAAAAVLGAGASAILVLPVLEYVPLAWNQHSSYPWGREFDQFYPIEGLRYLAPLVGGPIRHDIFHKVDVALKGFFGCAAAFFALTAFYERLRRVASVRWDAPILFFSAVAVLLLCKRFGAGFVGWFGSLPILWRTSWVKYEEPTTAFAVAVLAGIGIALLAQRRVSRVAAELAAATLILFIALMMLPYKEKLAGASDPWIFVVSIVAALGFIGAAYGVSVLAQGNLTPARVATVAIALLALEPLCTWVIPMYYVFAPGVPQSASPLNGAPFLSYLQTRGAGERVIAESGPLLPDWAQAFGISHIKANAPLYPERYFPFVQELVPGDDVAAARAFTGFSSDFHERGPRKFLALSSVAHVLVGCPAASPAECETVAAAKTVPGFTEEFSGPGVTIFGFRDALPRLGLFRHVVPAKDGASALATLRSPAFDETSEAVVEQPTGEAAALEQTTKGHVVVGTITTFESGYVRALVEAPERSLAVLTDCWFPGWHAFVDSREQPILRANYLFRGVVIPAGRHVVEFRYSPSSFQFGWTITAVSLVAIAALLLVAHRRRSAEGLSLPSSNAASAP